ncbi:serine/threonine-protein kinase [Geothrix sp. 21YS21S-2]|uniref:serine/threonine protein kinase n=1 Tax=Geothrix sp. 21YS21S-2 TaxID=3068893 RepID=UPI0027BA1CF9|nr:serine/threonine-protein kinase [Geothrix sp. 21YS21S-2]
MAKTIGKYEIIRSLGSGAMGEVYLARQAAIGREVAIKTILPNVAKGEEAEGRFRREAEAAGKLSHPNIVTIFDFDKDGDTFFLVMEFVKGDDLEDVIKHQALSHSQFLEVLAQVCDGLSHAHRNGIIHRDIKPANVRVIRDGKNLQAKVMDFGIARVEDSNMTATGIVMGTVSYMAPEYIRNGHATTQSDLFAVGVMLYECLTGRKPFAGDNTTTILFKIVSETAPPIDLSTIHGISHSIRNVLDKALSKEPGDRFQTADDFGKALRACKDPSWTGTLDEATAMITRHQEALAATPPAHPDETEVIRQPLPSPPTVMGRVAPAEGTALMPSVPAPAKAGGSRTGLFAAVGAVALAAVAGGGYLALRPRTPPAPLPDVQPPAPAAAPQRPEPAPAAQAGSPGTAPAPQAEPPRPEPVKAGPAKAEPARTETAKPAPPRPEPPKPEPPKAEPPKAAPPKAEPTGTKAVLALLDTDPRQAAAQAKAMAAADPGNAEVQGLYLAALYQSRNAWDFERGLNRAMASGLTVGQMLQAAPAFKKALAQEIRLQKANPPAGILPGDVMKKISAGL